MTPLEEILSSEVQRATLFGILTLIIFACAVIHTLMANQFTLLARKVAARHRGRVSFWSEVLYFFGEIEVVFALWVIPLFFVVTIFFGWWSMIDYLNDRVYTEPLFIVVIMSLASSRPIIRVAEKGMERLSRLFGGGVPAWWLVLMTIGPILGSFITEAAAMTITALLMQHKVYTHHPSKKLAYGSLGLMFVNFSVAGILTNFAAPPALTLARCWQWALPDFFNLFGWRVLPALLVVNLVYFLFLRKELLNLGPGTEKEDKKAPVPIWITGIHLFFVVWTIVMAHYPPIFLGGFLLYLGFHQATRPHQYNLNLKRPLLVGLFLAGLIIHAGFQGWWIEPLLGNLKYGALMVAGTILTAFNENTTVAALACLLDTLTPKLQYALAAGLVAGGGLTIIAHAPNPVGQSILRPYFKRGVSSWNLFLAALPPTLFFLAVFYFFPAK